jgi:hypothetical protein
MGTEIPARCPVRYAYSKDSIDWAPIPVFDDDPTCYLNAWDFLVDTKIHIVSSETLMS